MVQAAIGAFVGSAVGFVVAFVMLDRHWNQRLEGVHQRWEQALRDLRNDYLGRR